MGDVVAMRQPANRAEPADPFPPHDLAVERAMLCEIIVWGDETHPVLVRRQESALLVALDLLRPEHFYDPANGRIFQAIQALAAEKVRPDVVSLRARLVLLGWLAKIGGDDYLKQISTAPSAAVNAREHAIIIERKARLRQALAAVQAMAIEIRHGRTGDEEEYLSGLPAALSRVTKGGAAATCVTLREAFDLSFKEIERITQGGVGGYPTGIKTLDGLTGGVHPAEVVLLKAPKKSGKSVLVGQIACSIARRPRWIADHHWRWRGGLIFALEGKKQDWSSRMACSEAQVDYDALLKGQWGDRELQLFTRAADDLQRHHVRIEAEKKLTIEKIAARVLAVREEMLDASCLNCAGRGRLAIVEGGEPVKCLACEGSGRGVDLAFVALDYVQLLRDLTGSTRTNREQFLSAIVSELMDLASLPDLSGVAWVLVSQMNQGGVARESEAIEMHVDRVWRLQVAREREGGDALKARLNVEYSRRGPMGDDVNAAFWFEPSHTVFYG